MRPGPENTRHLAIRRARALGRPPAHRRRGGLHGADARPGTGHPPRPRRPRRPRRRPDRHRQDGRLHAADPRPAPPAREHLVLARAPPGPLPHPAPTRELAMQVDESVRTYGRTVPLRSTVVYGGIPMDPQIKALRAGVEILVATPGRLLDLVGQRVANLGQVEILVLDEADRMLDMGFLPDIQRILDLLPNRRQNLMFSATFSRRHPAPVGHDPADPETVEVAPRHRRRGRPPARLPGRPRPQGGAAGPPDRRGRPAPGARLHPDEARRVAPGVVARPGRRRGGGDPLRSLAAGADAGARGVQGGRDPGPRGDRRRGPRPRHRGPAPRRQLRAAVEPAGLHPPDRPDRPGRGDRRRDQPRLHRRGRPAARRPAAAPGAIPWKVEEGFIPRRDQEAQPLRAPRGAGGSSSGGRGRSGGSRERR